MKRKTRLSLIALGLLASGSILFGNFNHSKPKIPQTFNVPLEELIKNPNNYGEKEISTEGYIEYFDVSLSKGINSYYKLHIDSSTESVSFPITKKGGGLYTSPTEETINTFKGKKMLVYGKVSNFGGIYYLDGTNAKEVNSSTQIDKNGK